jgi:peptide/nickel transport system permease protein
MLIGSTVGVLFGVVAALHRGAPGDVGVRFVAIAGLSLPAFWLAMLFQLTFYSRLGWLPSEGGSLPASPLLPA